MGRREDFLDITMQLVAEKGFGGFSMKQVTKKMGVSEALIYKYFETKENLLYACFESMHMRVAALFKGYALPSLGSPAALYAAVRGIWMTYFDFLVKNTYKTVYYFDYRDSPYIKSILEHDDEARSTYFKDFGALMHQINFLSHFTDRMSEAHLWTYVLDTTGIFAKRVIRGELPKTEESYEATWTLISGGILSVLGGSPAF